MENSLFMYVVTMERDGARKGSKNMDSWSFIDRNEALNAIKSASEKFADRNPKFHLDVNKITSTNVQSFDYPFNEEDLI